MTVQWPRVDLEIVLLLEYLRCRLLKECSYQVYTVTICFISHSSEMGGAERVLLESIEALQKRGHNCKVVLPANGLMQDALERIDVEYRIISFPLWGSSTGMHVAAWFKTVLGTIWNVVLVARAVRQWKASMVYTSTVTVCVGALAARLLGIPHIWHIQEFGRDDHGITFILGENRSRRLVGTLSAKCIFVSATLATDYSPFIPREKIAVVYPCVQAVTSQFGGANTQNKPSRSQIRFRCVIVGTVIEGKGQAISLQAIALLKKAGSIVDLVIVGDGPQSYRSVLNEIIMENNLSNQVSFTGRLQDPSVEIRLADVLLVCSRREAFGRTTIEGMFAGKPVIGARSGATEELIQNGVNGLLFRNGDAEELAARILELKEHPDLTVRLGLAAQAWAMNRFTAERFADDLCSALFPSSTVPLCTPALHDEISAISVGSQPNQK